MMDVFLLFGSELVFSSGIALFIYILTIVSLLWWKKVAEKNGITGKDMHKKGKPKIAESGGIIVTFSIVISLLLLIFSKTFIMGTQTHVVEILAVVATLLFACFVGFTDDVLGWKKGLSKFSRVFLTLIIAIPLMVINAGESSMVLPFFGSINFGVLYPLLIIPLGIVGASNGFNMLGGVNGLETAQGILILSMLGVLSFFTEVFWVTYISGISCFVMAAFYVFNANPSEIFPGNSFTYSIGALIASVAILGNLEKFALIVFIPYFIEFFLKAYGGFKKESFGVLRGNKIHKKYKKIYSMTHIFMPNKEEDIFKSIIVIQMIWIIAALVVFLF